MAGPCVETHAGQHEDEVHRVVGPCDGKPIPSGRGPSVPLPCKQPLRRFQKTFLKRALDPSIDTAGLSMPRANGKTWLAADILEHCLTPDDALFIPESEYLLTAASIEQARLCFKFIRQELEPSGAYRFLDSSTRIGITHKASNTRLRVLSSNGKTGMGIVGCPLLVADEPGSWETVGGQLLNDAIMTAMGKPGSHLKAIFIGTLAPATSGWWHEMIEDGSHGSTYIQALQGDPEKWDQWSEIRRCNPLTAISADFRRKLLEERDAARRDPRLKARFLSFRLNAPSRDESEMLLTTTDFSQMCGREVPAREGQPIVAVDLGGGRSWSAATAVWQNGRVEAIAVAPGVPSLEAQEKRDRVAAATYRSLAEHGLLHVAEALQVQPPASLWEMILERWGVPVRIVCDRYRLAELSDAVRGACPLTPRVTRWSESSQDIRALRSLAKDGPLAVETHSRLLLAASLSVAMVKSDDSGNVRLVKSGSNNTARDDVAFALTLAAGAYARAMLSPAEPSRLVVV